jgi:hypothetical protein
MTNVPIIIQKRFILLHGIMITKTNTINYSVYNISPDLTLINN